MSPLHDIISVDPDHRGVESNGSPELLGIVRLHERVETEHVRSLHQTMRLCVVEVPQKQEHSIGTALACRPQMLHGGEEAFRQERYRSRPPRRAQVIPRSAEARVDEDRDGRGPWALL